MLHGFGKCVYKSGCVPVDLTKAVTVPLYEGSESKNYRRISLSSIVCKIYGRNLIDHVKRRVNVLLVD